MCGCSSSPLPFASTFGASVCGDWFICARTFGVSVGFSGIGVLKAPVLAFWSFSNSSCSSFGRRGGAGPGDQLVCAGEVVLRGLLRMRRRA